ncbi:MAG: HAD-IA family hydrolase [Acidimicrobiales bacterium]
MSARTGDAALRAVLWDFGGVLTTSPFESFARYEAGHGLPAGFIRRLNSTNPDANAWAALERGEVDIDTFARRFEAEAADSGGCLEAPAVLAALRGEVRPEMVDAVRRCRERLKTGLLTNNFVMDDGPADHGSILEHFDVVLESSRAGCRKPDPRFYEMACERLEVHPSEAVFLDDLGVNLKPARAMGMRTIKVTDPATALDELEAIVGFALRSRP